MSLNVILTDTKDIGSKYILTRAGAGITHSAMITTNDWLKFDHIYCKVVEITHEFQPPGSKKAPNSIIRCVANVEFDNDMINALKKLGFEELVSHE